MKQWEVEVLAFVRDNPCSGDRFVDIGAWIGPYSLLASRLVESSGRVYAIEPDPVASVALKRNISENEALNITVVPWAITEQKGMVELTPYVLGDSRTKVSPGHEGQQVVSVSLDEFCDTESLVPSVIKIDVEGAEPRVLDGGRRALQRARAVIVEVHQREILESAMDSSHFWRRLFELGKRAFLLNAIGGTATGTELSPELMVPGNVHILLH